MGSSGFKNLWIKSIAFVPYPVLHWVMSASPVRHLPMHLLWLLTGLLGGMSRTYFCVTVFLFTGGYEYPPPPPYSYHETTTVEQPGMWWGTVFLTTIIILLLTKAKWFWFSSLQRWSFLNNHNLRRWKISPEMLEDNLRWQTQTHFPAVASLQKHSFFEPARTFIIITLSPVYFIVPFLVTFM